MYIPIIIIHYCTLVLCVLAMYMDCQHAASLSPAGPACALNGVVSDGQCKVC